MNSTIDTDTAKVVDSRLAVHEYVFFCTGKICIFTGNATRVAINRIKRCLPNVLATGDDDGVVKVRIAPKV